MTVVVAQRFLVLGRALAYHEGVVADGLYLEVVIERRYFKQFALALARDHGAEQLARLARTAYDYALAVLLQHAARYARMLVEVVQVCFGHYAVEVGKSVLRLCQQYYVPRFCVLVSVVKAVQVDKALYLGVLRVDYA